MNNQSKKSQVELAVELIKALAWPVFAFVVLFSFWQPLQSTVNQLPELVSQSDNITIAGLSLKIDRNLQLQGKEPTLEVKNALAKLTPDDISRLLELTTSACYRSDGADSARARHANLFELGLFREISVTTFQNSPDCVFAIEVTGLGKETQKYLYALITEFVQQLNQPVPASTTVPSQSQ